MSELYDDEELQRLTDCKRANDQAAWLAERGIPHRREGKRVLVSRVHVRAWLEGHTITSPGQPNWAGLSGPVPRRAHA